MTGQPTQKPNEKRRRPLPNPRDIALEIVRRARVRAGDAERFDGFPYVLRLSDPPTRLLRTPIAIVPHPCKTTDEWMARYATGGTS